MEGFQDEQPNGDLSSSDEDGRLDEYPFRAATYNKGPSVQATTSTNKPNLVNGHSPKTYHNGLRGRNEEPVVRKGVPSRDYFEDSDSYPKLVTPGEGEPDICDDVEYCDLDHNEDQTQAEVLRDSDEGVDVAETTHNFGEQSSNSPRPTEDHESRTLDSNGYDDDSALHSNNSKDIHDSIVSRSSSQLSGHGQNGATSRLGSDSKHSDMVAQDTDMDKQANKDEELMVSISGSGRISLIPADEPKKHTTVVSPQKGAYIGPGPSEHKQVPETGFGDQKKRFEALRKKFSEPGSFSKSGSESDGEENRQEKEDEPKTVLEKHVHEVQVPLSDRNSSIQQPNNQGKYLELFIRCIKFLFSMSNWDKL